MGRILKPYGSRLSKRLLVLLHLLLLLLVVKGDRENGSVEKAEDLDQEGSRIDDHDVTRINDFKKMRMYV